MPEHGPLSPKRIAEIQHEIDAYRGYYVSTLLRELLQHATALEAALTRAESHLSLLVFRAEHAIPWGDVGIGPRQEYVDVIGIARRLLYGKPAARAESEGQNG